MSHGPEAVKPVDCTVITEPIDNDQASLLRGSFLKQNIGPSQINAKYNQIIEQILF